MAKLAWNNRVSVFFFKEGRCRSSRAVGSAEESFSVKFWGGTPTDSDEGS